MLDRESDRLRLTDAAMSIARACREHRLDPDDTIHVCTGVICLVLSTTTEPELRELFARRCLRMIAETADMAVSFDPEDDEEGDSHA
jgi:hypothetical protein